MNGNGNEQEQFGQDRVGFTDDGFVFMVVWSQFEGKPTKTIMQWSPERALRICKAISMAVEGAKSRVENV